MRRMLWEARMRERVADWLALVVAWLDPSRPQVRRRRVMSAEQVTGDDWTLWWRDREVVRVSPPQRGATGQTAVPTVWVVTGQRWGEPPVKVPRGSKERA